MIPETLPALDEVLSSPACDSLTVLGPSREGRDVRGHRIGTGATRLSLIAGCHADEPVGPRLLRHLVGTLLARPEDDPLLTDYEWWIVADANPDGAARNASWATTAEATYDPVDYLLRAERELPGDDVEFGFPRTPDDVGSRPENRAIARWWTGAPGPFHLHVSFHGMAVAGGPWFLVDPCLLNETWRDPARALRDRCRRRVFELGYRLHDVERHGDKGFTRIEPGFCTRPHSSAMRDHFLALNDTETAELFRPSSMETIRGLGGDPLTLVTEMPLFIAPGIGDTIGPPDPVADAWRQRVLEWRVRLGRGDEPSSIRLEMKESGLRAMPIRDQLDLQWTLLAAGLEAIRGRSGVNAAGTGTC